MSLANLVFATAIATSTATATAASALVAQLLPDERIEQCRNAVRSQTGLVRVPDPEPVVSQFIYRTRIEIKNCNAKCMFCPIR